MTVSLSQVHKVLQIYGRQMNIGERLRRRARTLTNQSAIQPGISAETKRAVVVERVSSAIIDRMAEVDFSGEGVESQVLNDLSLEYGQPLILTQDALTGEFIFHIIDPVSRTILETLDRGECEALSRKMLSIAREIIDRTMI